MGANNIVIGRLASMIFLDQVGPTERDAHKTRSFAHWVRTLVPKFDSIDPNLFLPSSASRCAWSNNDSINVDLENRVRYYSLMFTFETNAYWGTAIAYIVVGYFIRNYYRKRLYSPDTRYRTTATPTLGWSDRSSRSLSRQISA